MSKIGLVKKIVCLIVGLFVAFSCFAEIAEGTVEGCYCHLDDEEKYDEAIYTGSNKNVLQLIANLMKDGLDDYEVEDGYGLYFSNQDIDFYYYEEQYNWLYYEDCLGMFKTIVKRFGEYSRIIIEDEDEDYIYYFLQINQNVWLYVMADL